MRVFLLAVICVAIGGTITALALQHFQKPVSEAFASTGTRLSAN